MDRENVAIGTYLSKRGNIWHLRMRVPTALVSVVGMTHIARSLKTTDKREARRLANLQLADIESRFREAENSLRPSLSISRRLDELSDGEIERIVVEWFQREANLARDDFFSCPEADEATADDAPFGPNELLKDLRDDLATMENASERQGSPALSQVVGEAAKYAGLELRNVELGKLRLARVEIAADLSGRKYKKFRELVRKAWCERLRLEIALHEGERHKLEYREVIEGTDRNGRSGTSATQITLKQLIGVFTKEPKYDNRRKTLKYKYELLFRLLLEVLGEEKQVSEIGRPDCRAVVDLLKRLPANAKKKFPNMSFTEIADHVDALPEGKKPPLLNGKTLSSHVYRMSTFFKYAEMEEYIVKNPARGFDLGDNKHSKDDKHPFRLQQLEDIFGAPLFTGAVEPATGEKTDYSEHKNTTRYWVAIIALYQGMRLNEVCQLRIDELKCDSGIHYFHLQEVHEDQRLKSDNSRRMVPFHPALLHLGFLAYVEQTRKSGAERLFPDLKLDGRGYYSRNVGRWFNERFFVDRGVKSRKHTFHSFRHNFQDACRGARIQKSIIETICGRDEGGTGADYGEGYSLKVLNEEISKISYETVTLTPLPCFVQE